MVIPSRLPPLSFDPSGHHRSSLSSQIPQTRLSSDPAPTPFPPPPPPLPSVAARRVSHREGKLGRPAWNSMPGIISPGVGAGETRGTLEFFRTEISRSRRVPPLATTAGKQKERRAKLRGIFIRADPARIYQFYIGETARRRPASPHPIPFPRVYVIPWRFARKDRPAGLPVPTGPARRSSTFPAPRRSPFLPTPPHPHPHSVPLWRWISFAPLPVSSGRVSFLTPT